MKHRIFSVLTASCVLLCACGGDESYGTNLPEVYKDFLDYTFDGSYTVTLTEEDIINRGEDNERGYRHWDITFTDALGNQCTEELRGSVYTGWTIGSYPTQAHYDLAQLYSFCTGRMGATAQHDLWDTVLTKHFPDMEFDTEGPTFTEDSHCRVSTLLMMRDSTGDDAEFRYQQAMMQPQTGYCIAKTGFTEFMQYEEAVLTLLIDINHTEDAQQYLEKVKQIEAEILAIAGEKPNYQLILRQYHDAEQDEREVLYEHNVLLGEDFTPDPEIEYDNVAKAVERHWRETWGE